MKAFGKYLWADMASHGDVLRCLLVVQGAFSTVLDSNLVTRTDQTSLQADALHSYTVTYRRLLKYCPELDPQIVNNRIPTLARARSLKQSYRTLILNPILMPARTRKPSQVLPTVDSKNHLKFVGLVLQP